METGIVLQQMLILVLLMAVGFGARRLNIMDQDTKVHITRILLKVTLPATLLASMTGSPIDVDRGEVPFLFFIIVCAFIAMGVVSWLVPILLRTPREERGAYMALGLFGNVNFMGIPLIYAFFGAAGMLYGILYNIVFNLLIFSLGIKLIGGKETKLSIKLFLSPVMISGVISVILFLLDVQLPYVPHRSLSLLGGITSPMAMLLLGAVLGEMNAKEMFQGWKIWVGALVRLFFAPLGVFFALSLFPLEPMVIQIMVIISATPGAISMAMFAIEHNRNQELVSKGIFLSTLLSVVVLPLLLSLVF